MGIRQEAGRRHEQDVDFHLRRGLIGEDKIYLFKNLKFEVGGETAQIDHLLLHKYGFTIIESKSVYGEIRVNGSGEWSRSFKGDWYGIPSPIVQAENQQAILKQTLQTNADSLLGTLLGFRKGFGGRKYDVLVAISSSAIIHREEMPKEINKSTAKAEFLGSRVKELVSGLGGILGAPNPWFTDSELTAIRDFLAGHQQESVRPEIKVPEPTRPAPTPKATPHKTKPNPRTPSPRSASTTASSLICKHCNNTEGFTEKSGRWGAYVACPKCSKNTPVKDASQDSALVKAVAATPPVSPVKTQPKPATKAKAETKAKTLKQAEPTPASPEKLIGWVITCKHCKNTEKLTGKYGKHGYYVVCSECSKNTPMKADCLKCHGKSTRVRKEKNSYTLACGNCGDVALFESST